MYDRIPFAFEISQEVELTLDVAHNLHTTQEMVKRKVEDSDVGLQVLYEVPHPSVDIVAVHGIGAHREETWSARVDVGGKTKWLNWLSDETMLRSELSDIRVLNFGYKSDWFGSPVQHSLSSLGNLLWTSLNLMRERCQDRPIIFVAHCFGGLIVMRVLIERSQWSIAQATAGIAFLGTPFRGTDERFHRELPTLAEANIGGVDDKILHYLRKDNSTLEDLRDTFLEMRNSDIPRVVCFYELLETEVNKIVNEPQPMKFIVVEKGSATLDRQRGIDKFPFQRNHFQLNKFKSPSDEDFKVLCNFLREFKDLAVNKVHHELATDMARRQHSIAQPHAVFQPEGWIETPLTVLVTRDMKVEKLKIKSEKKFSPSSSGISLDCDYMFLRDDHSIHVYSVADIQRCHAIKSIPLPVLTYSEPPNKKGESSSNEIHGVSIGRTVCASITKTSCTLHRFLGGRKQHQAIRHMSHENNWTLSCVAVSETTIDGDLIIVALGLQQERNGFDYGKVELHSIWQNDWREHTKIQSMDLRDHVTGMTDSPKTLSFSLDGAILTCTTQRHNQIHGWQLPTAEAPRKIKKICETTRPFNTGVNAKGITSATAWVSPTQRPYVLCTTSPSAERDVDGGEWTFIAPLSIPFAPWASERAYHCLRQVQGDDSPHLHIHASAVSPQGNLVALLDSNGRICLIPIRARRGGGMVSNDSVAPVEVRPGLGRNEDLMAGLRFNLSGTKLFAINWNSEVLVVDFPHANPMDTEPRARRALTFMSQATLSPSLPYGTAFSPRPNQPSSFVNNELQPPARQFTSRDSIGSGSTGSANVAPDDTKYSETSTAMSLSGIFGKPTPESEEVVESQSPLKIFQNRRHSTWRWSLKSPKTMDKK